MKIVKVIIVMLLSMVLFTGCSGRETPQTVYLIGEEYTFETIKVKLENDEAKEQFVLYYEVLAQDESTHYFSFTIINNTETLKIVISLVIKIILNQRLALMKTDIMNLAIVKHFIYPIKKQMKKLRT